MVNLNVGQSFTVTVEPDAKLPDGSLTKGQIDGPPSWSIDNPAICHIVVTPDGLSCSIAALAAGSCVVQPTALANGQKIQGDPIQCVVAVPPLPFATQLTETIGPVS